MGALGRRGAVGLIVVLATLLLVRGLELRMPALERAFWEDEIHHNEPILESRDMAALDRNPMYLAMFQPKLDFWMRKALWFRAFGVNERGLRLPALVTSCVTVLVVFTLLLVSCAPRIGVPCASLLAFIGALWIVDNPTELHYATEARHYALVVLASILWCGSLFSLEGRHRVLLAFASLLFVNAHFFSLPLVAAGYVLTIARDLRQRRWGWIGFHLLVCVALYVCTTRVNLSSLVPLFASPPGDRGSRAARLAALVSPATIKAGGRIWLDYARRLALWPSAFVWWAVVLIDAVVRRRTRWIALLGFVLVGLPVLFTYMAARSGYDFLDRYHLPFFGFGFCTVAAVLDIGIDGWALASPERRRAAAVAALVVLALVMGVPRFGLRLFPEMTALRAVRRNFSEFYKADVELVQEGLPTLVVHSHCFADDMQSIYFRHILPRARIPVGRVEWIDAGGCVIGQEAVSARLQRFLETTPLERLIVIDQKEAACAGKPLPLLAPPVRIERFASVSSCIWKLRDVTTRAQVADAALALGVPHAENLR